MKKSNVPMKRREVKVMEYSSILEDDTIKNFRSALAKEHNVDPKSIVFEVETYDDYGDCTYPCITASFCTPKLKKSWQRNKE